MGNTKSRSRTPTPPRTSFEAATDTIIKKFDALVAVTPNLNKPVSFIDFAMRNNNDIDFKSNQDVYWQKVRELAGDTTQLDEFAYKKIETSLAINRVDKFNIVAKYVTFVHKLHNGDLSDYWLNQFKLIFTCTMAATKDYDIKLIIDVLLSLHIHLPDADLKACVFTDTDLNRIIIDKVSLTTFQYDLYRSWAKNDLVPANNRKILVHRVSQLC